MGTQRLYQRRTESILEIRRFLDGFWDEGLQRSNRRPRPDPGR